MPITRPQLTPNLMQKRIPTLLGLGFLVIGLIVGVVFIGRGSGIFAPRATPETTPKQVHISNITDTTFTVSFLTDSATTGVVEYGTTENDLESVAQDDRAAVSANATALQTHHITARGLTAGTTYYFLIKTGSGSLFDNNGSVFSVMTAKKAGTPVAAKTIYGTVLSPSGAPASEGIVYVTPEGAEELSTRLSENGTWALPLSNARTPDGSNYASITDSTPLRVFVQSKNAAETISHISPVSKAQPVTTLSFVAGKATEVASAVAESTTETITVETSNEVAVIPEDTTESDSDTTTTGEVDMTSSTGSSSAQKSSKTSRTSFLAEESTSSAALDESTIVLLESAVPEELTTTTPVIKGKAAANVEVTIDVHSDTQISDTVTTDQQGNFEIDISEYEQELEPGEHTVTYSYSDPISGETVTKTKTFTVLAQASSTEQPYGTGNPYPIGGTATASASPTSTTSATASPRTTIPSTSSGVPVSGAVGTTLALIFGGAFFIISGVWSFWVSKAFATTSPEE